MDWNLSGWPAYSHFDGVSSEKRNNNWYSAGVNCILAVSAFTPVEIGNNK